MKKRKLILPILFIASMLVGVSSPVYSGDDSRTGTAGGVQVLVPVGARDLAMMGSNIAYTRGVDAIYWNPAGLSTLDNRAAGVFSTMSFLADINVNYLAVAVAAGRLGHVGFSLKTFDFGEIPVTTNQDMDGASGRTFSPTFITTGLTYSKRLTDAIQIGVTGKVISESVPRASATAFAIDAGIQYHGFGGINGLSVGFTVKNVGTDMQYSGGAFLEQVTNPETGLPEFRELPTASNELPANIEMGLGYKYGINETNNVILSGIFQSNNFGNDTYSLGGEYAYSDLIALRGGYRFHENIDSEDVLNRFTLGFGLHYKVGATDLTFDYAYRDSQYFDGNNMFSLTIGF